MTNVQMCVKHRVENGVGMLFKITRYTNVLNNHFAYLYKCTLVTRATSLCGNFND